jgi:hypothetical protein
MAIWKRIEEALWTGKHVKDYGPVSEGLDGLSKRTVSALLTRRSSGDRFVLRVNHKAAGLAFLAAGVDYIDFDRDGALKLKIALDDALLEMK